MFLMICVVCGGWIIWRERAGERSSMYSMRVELVLRWMNAAVKYALRVVYDDATGKHTTCHSYIELTPPGKGISISIERIKSVL